MVEKLIRLRDGIRKKTGNSSLLEVYGMSELLITGVLSLMDFSESLVVVDTVDGIVSICGSALEMTAYRADLVCVSGRISKIEVEWDDR